VKLGACARPGAYFEPVIKGLVPPKKKKGRKRNRKLEKRNLSKKTKKAGKKWT